MKLLEILSLSLNIYIYTHNMNSYVTEVGNILYFTLNKHLI